MIPFGLFKNSTLLIALSTSQIVNFFIPFKIGDILRMALISRKIKTLPLIIATVIIERITDIYTILFIIVILLIYSNFDISNSLNMNQGFIQNMNSYIYISITIGIVLSTILFYSNFFKKVVVKIAEQLEISQKVGFLKFMHNMFFMSRNIIRNINILKFFLQTFLMWAAYISSYYFFSIAIFNESNVLKSFSLFFSISHPLNFYSSSFISLIDITLAYALFYFVPSILLFTLGIIIKLFEKNNFNKSNEIHNRFILNFKNIEEEEKFYVDYFYTKNRNWSKSYFRIFSGTKILQDFSGLSDASTVLVNDLNGKIVYRKYYIGQNIEILNEQIELIRSQKVKKYFPEILRYEKNRNWIFYDMKYIKDNITLIDSFNFLDTVEVELLMSNIFKILDNIFYSKTIKKLKYDQINYYIENKLILNSKTIFCFLKEKGVNFSKPLVANNIETNYTISEMMHWLNLNYDQFKKTLLKDTFSLSHGDLTGENIIINRKKKNIFFIDLLSPAYFPGSKSFDLAKLKMSLNDSFEKIRKIEIFSLENNKVHYVNTVSEVEKFASNLFFNYLKKTKFNEKIFDLHSLIHWSRVTSRRIRSNDDKSIIYAAKFIQQVDSNLMKIK